MRRFPPPPRHGSCAFCYIPPMLRFLLWRLVQSIVVLWAVYTVTFFLLMLTPGDPFISSEKKAPDSVRQALAEKYGLEYLTRTDKATLSVPAKLYYMRRGDG